MIYNIMYLYAVKRQIIKKKINLINFRLLHNQNNYLV